MTLHGTARFLHEIFPPPPMEFIVAIALGCVVLCLLHDYTNRR